MHSIFVHVCCAHCCCGNERNIWKFYNEFMALGKKNMHKKILYTSSIYIKIRFILPCKYTHVCQCIKLVSYNYWVILKPCRSTLLYMYLTLVLWRDVISINFCLYRRDTSSANENSLHLLQLVFGKKIHTRLNQKFKRKSYALFLGNPIDIKVSWAVCLLVLLIESSLLLRAGKLADAILRTL